MSSSNGTSRSNGRSSFELEADKEEITSLVSETGGGIRKRRENKRPKYFQDVSPYTLASAVKTGLEKTRSYKHSLKYIAVVFLLGMVALFFLFSVDESLEKMEEDIFDRRPHESHFGGINNLGSPGGARFHKPRPIVIPDSNTGTLVQSVTIENVMNNRGHYVHDEHRSPFASHLYDRDQKSLEKEQEEYEAKMKKVREEWGAWNFEDPEYDGYTKIRPKPEFHKAAHGDISVSSFPKDSWQNDEDYVSDFLDEARDLVKRVREGIYAEYGYPTVDSKGKELTEKERKKRDEMFQIITHDFYEMDGQAKDITNNKFRTAVGVAYLRPNAWEGLIRKLLHAMIVHDDFFVVMGGHGAAGGNGLNFHMNQIMSFHHVMEPVFDKLGMRLVSRNMAHFGVGTPVFALGGSDLYGETDILWWQADAHDVDPGTTELFNNQAVLSGEKVPIILTPFGKSLLDATNKTAWVGNFQKDIFVKTTESERQAQQLPWAVRYLKCSLEIDGRCRRQISNSVCWVPRTDHAPTASQDKMVTMNQWTRSWRQHQLEGRKLALILLAGIDAAIDKWQNGVEIDGFPLKEEYWHVGREYEKIRTNLRTSRPAEDEYTDCEKLFYKFPIVCRVPMHGYTEWTPRVDPQKTSLLQILKNAPNGYIPVEPQVDFDSDFDLLPLKWKVPDDAIDVHAIAIASRKPPPDLDQSLNWDDDDLWIRRTEETGDYDPEDIGHISNRVLSEVEEGADTFPFTLTEVDNEYSSSLDPPERKEALGEFRSGRCGNGKCVHLPLRAELSPPSGNLLGARRAQETDDIVPGQGWMLYKGTSGYCDGSSQSMCNRDPENKCMMENSNSGVGSLLGDGYSGWLVFEVPNVKVGVILARIDWSVPGKSVQRTEHWKVVNDGKTYDTTPYFTVAPAVGGNSHGGVSAETVNGVDDNFASNDDGTSDNSGKHVEASTDKENHSVAGQIDNTSKNIEVGGGAPGGETSSPGDKPSQENAGYSPNGNNDATATAKTAPKSNHATQRKKINRSHRPVSKPHAGSGGRQLHVPKDNFAFEYAVNGVVNTLLYDEFLEALQEIVEKTALFPLLVDEEMIAKHHEKNGEGKKFEIAMRVRSFRPRDATIAISHIYYA